MKLIGMMDSPYVRRVAVSLALYGVEFESLPLSVFSGFDEFSRINPVVKAPTVVLDNGKQLMDSTLILHYFETTNPAGRRLLPTHPEALARDLHLLGVILAACEKAVQHVYEHRLRPEEKQHQPWIARVTGQLLAACREWDARLADRAAAAQPDQVLVTSTVVWSFIQLMIPAVVSAAAFPHIRALAEKGRRCRRFNSIRWVNGRGGEGAAAWRPEAGEDHQQTNPPSTTRSTPVQNEAASLARNSAGPAISSTFAIRCIGVWLSNSRVWCTISGRVFIGVAVYPGLMELTRIPLPTHSIARLFDRWITPALEQL